MYLKNKVNNASQLLLKNVYFIVIVSLLAVYLFLPFSSDGKSKTDNSEKIKNLSPHEIGAAFMLIGESSAKSVKDLLTHISNLDKKMKRLSEEEKNFLFGYANYRIGEYSIAKRYFEKINNPLVLDYLLLYRAKIAIREKQYQDAEQLLKRLISTCPKSTLALDARLSLAEVQLKSRKYDEAKENANMFIKFAPSRAEKFEAQLIILRSYIDEQNLDNIYKATEEALAILGSEIELEKIERLMAEADKKLGTNMVQWIKSPSVSYKIAKSLAGNSQWESALNYLEKAELEGFNNKIEAKLLKVRLFLKVRKFTEAIALIEELLKKDLTQGQKLELQSQLASAYARLGDYKRSIALRDEIIKEHYKNPRVVLNSLEKKAFLLTDERRYNDAIRLWNKILKMKKEKRLHLKALWYIAWSYYKLGKYEDALDALNNILKHTDANDGKVANKAKYWKAKILEVMGKSSEASAIYSEIVKGSPTEYYEELASRRLQNAENTASDFTSVVSEIKPINDWTIDISDANSFDLLHLRRAIFFDRLNLHEEAALELSVAFEEISSKKRNDFETNVLLVLASRNFAHDIAYAAAQKYYKWLLDFEFPLNGFKRFIWEQLYPEAYKPIVESFCGYSLDPRLVYAIMKAESSFKQRAVSTAGAIGLMQIMPDTAKKIAALKNRDFDIKRLYRPLENLEYGIEYLKKLNKIFNGNKVAMIASYNAGEEAVGAWLKHNYSDDIEEFIEEIPYEETNLYVKKVLSNYWVLQKLYPR